MSLRRALERLPSDPKTRAGVRDALRYFSSRPDEWVPVDSVVSAIAAPGRGPGEILGQLVRGFVLDFEDAPPRYRYHPDTVLELEVRTFLRRADSHTHRLQGNVERFRSRLDRRGAP